MKVASFNVNSIRVRLPIVLAWLQKNQPDVLAMQETKVQDESFPKEPFEAIGYRCVFRGQKSYNGVALASRHEIEHVKFGLPDEPRDEARLVTAQVRGMTLVNTYIPQGYLAETDRFQYKLDWFARLLAWFRTRFTPTDPILWMGDLNVAPLPIDVYDRGGGGGPRLLSSGGPQGSGRDHGLGLHGPVPQALRGGGPVHLLGLQARELLRQKPRVAHRPPHGDRSPGGQVHRLHHRQGAPGGRPPQRPHPDPRGIRLVTDAAGYLIVTVSAPLK